MRLHILPAEQKSPARVIGHVLVHPAGAGEINQPDPDSVTQVSAGRMRNAVSPFVMGDRILLHSSAECDILNIIFCGAHGPVYIPMHFRRTGL